MRLDCISFSLRHDISSILALLPKDVAPLEQPVYVAGLERSDRYAEVQLGDVSLKGIKVGLASLALSEFLLPAPLLSFELLVIRN